MIKPALKPTYLLFSALIVALRDRLRTTSMSRQECFLFLQSIVVNTVKSHDLRASKGKNKGELLAPKVGPLLTLADDVGILRERSGAMIYSSAWEKQADRIIGEALRDAHQVRSRESNRRRQLKNKGKPKPLAPLQSPSEVFDSTPLINVVVNGFEVRGTVNDIRELIQEQG